jgi:hypothetical protein
MVVSLPSKQIVPVRFWSLAPRKYGRVVECNGLLNRRSKDPQVRILLLPPFSTRPTAGHRPLEARIVVRIHGGKLGPYSPAVEAHDLKS